MNACKEHAVYAASAGIELYNACLGQVTISRFLVKTVCPIIIQACEKVWDLWKPVEDGFLDIYTSDIAAICKQLQKLETQNRLDETFTDSAGNELSGQYFLRELYYRSSQIVDALKQEN